MLPLNPVVDMVDGDGDRAGPVAGGAHVLFRETSVLLHLSPKSDAVPFFPWYCSHAETVSVGNISEGARFALVLSCRTIYFFAYSHCPRPPHLFPPPPIASLVVTCSIRRKNQLNDCLRST